MKKQNYYLNEENDLFCIHEDEYCVYNSQVYSFGVFKWIAVNYPGRYLRSETFRISKEEAEDIINQRKMLRELKK